MSSTLDRVATVPTTPPKGHLVRGPHQRPRVPPPLVVAVVAVLIWWVAAVLVDSLIFPTPAEAMPRSSRTWARQTLVPMSATRCAFSCSRFWPAQS